jgi:hypothetical protein
MQQKGSNGASGYDGSLGYTLNTRNISGREQHQVQVMHPQTVANVGFLYPRSAAMGASSHSQAHGIQTKGPKGAFFDERNPFIDASYPVMPTGFVQQIAQHQQAAGPTLSIDTGNVNAQSGQCQGHIRPDRTREATQGVKGDSLTYSLSPLPIAPSNTVPPQSWLESPRRGAP